MTTREKILALVDQLKQTPIDDGAGEGRDLIELVQIAEGFGIDLFGQLVPQTNAEADVMIDKLLALGFQLRGDDLAPFDLEHVAREAGE